MIVARQQAELASPVHAHQIDPLRIQREPDRAEAASDACWRKALLERILRIRVHAHSPSRALCVDRSSAMRRRLCDRIATRQKIETERRGAVSAAAGSDLSRRGFE